MLGDTLDDKINLQFKMFGKITVPELPEPRIDIIRYLPNKVNASI